MNVVIVNCFDTYEHRVELLYEYFKKREDNVTVYTSDFRHIEKVKRTDVKEGYIFCTAKPYKKNISVSRMFSHASLAKKIFSILEKREVDLLWVLIPPNSFVKEAIKLKCKKKEMKLIFDVIDMWPETMPVERVKNFFPIQKWKKIRDTGIGKADYVVTECDLFQEALKEVVGQKKMSTIYLARECQTFMDKSELEKNRFTLCYLGSINNIINIPAIEQIIKELSKKQPVRLHIIGDGEKREEFIKNAQAAGAEVFYHGKIYDKEKKEEIFSKCHYGLNIMKDSVYVGLTMKSVDYFEAGLPIINNIKGDTWRLVEDYDMGVNFSDLSDVSVEKSIVQRQNARTFFENKLSLESFNKSLEDVLQKI